MDPEVDDRESGGRPMRRGSLHISICVLMGSARRSVLGKVEGLLYDSRVLIGAFAVLPASFIDGNLA